MLLERRTNIKEWHSAYEKEHSKYHRIKSYVTVFTLGTTVSGVLGILFWDNPYGFLTIPTSFIVRSAISSKIDEITII